MCALGRWVHRILYSGDPNNAFNNMLCFMLQIEGVIHIATFRYMPLALRCKEGVVDLLTLKSFGRHSLVTILHSGY